MAGIVPGKKLPRVYLSGRKKLNSRDADVSVRVCRWIAR